MKRLRLKSRRDRVVLPGSRHLLKKSWLPLLREILLRGKEEAKIYIRSQRLSEQQIQSSLLDLEEKTADFPGLRHLCRALFYAGIHLELHEALDAQELKEKMTQQNLVISGSLLHKELPLTQLHFSKKGNLSILNLPSQLTELPFRWWTQQYAGAITVARLAFFLVQEGMRVFFPLPAEDVAQKIDLLAQFPGESGTLCFQVKSKRNFEWAEYEIHHSTPNGHHSKATHHLWQGVEKFSDEHHGIYIPIELTFGSSSFADGEIESKGFFPETLREMLTQALQDPVSS